MSKRSTNSSRLPTALVVGVDGEGLADHAIRAALDLGRLLGAKVELVHAVASPPLQWPGVDPVRSAALTAEILTGAWKNVTERVRNVVGRMGTDRNSPSSIGSPDAAGASSSQAGTAVAVPAAEDLVRVIPGPPAKVILDEARKTRADVIVLGAHARRGALDFGSTARVVLAKAPVAVWVQTHCVRPIERILVPVDLSDESLSALSSACGLARIHGARVKAVHFFAASSYAVAAGLDYPGLGPAFSLAETRKTDQAEFEGTMKAFDWRGVEHDAEFQDGEPADRILELSRAADLIVLGTHGRTGLASVVLGNVAYSVLKRSEIPVLAIRHPERRFLA